MIPCSTVNGLSVEKIERRCIPCPDKTKFQDWRYTSAQGFLGPNEGLLQVIDRDKDALEKLQVTKEWMARELKNLLAIISVEVTVDGLEKTIVTHEGNTFLVSRCWYVGKQYSPFFNEDIPESPHNLSWNVEWKIRCEENALEILVSGDQTAGIASLIEEYGFFEGGLDGSNPYRLDPDVLYCVLSSKNPITMKAQEYIGLRKKQAKLEIEKKKKDLMNEIQPMLTGANAKEAEAFLKREIEKMDQQILNL